MKKVTPIKLGQAAIATSKGKFETRHIPHTVNALYTMHWTRRRKWKQAWEEQVYYAIMEKRTEFRKFPLKCPHIIFNYYQMKEMDEDNMRGSVKPLLDGLVKAGVLIDDTPKHVTHEVKQHKVKKRKEQYVEIIFEI